MIKRLAIILALLLLPHRVSAAIAVINSTVEPADAPNATTSDAISTIGATLLIATAHWFGADTDMPAGISDSASNSWTCLAGAGQGPTQTTICYVNAPTTSATHTVTVGITAGYAAMTVLAVSGSLAASPFDQQNSGNDANVTSLSASGGITPTLADELVISAVVTLPPTLSHTTPSGYTLIGGGTVNGVGSVTMGGGAAYLIQTTATATDPTWSWTGATDAAATVACFKASTTSSSGPCTLATTGAGRC